MTLTALELCAGAGGQALGLHRAGFRPLALVDNDAAACRTLKRNFRRTKVIEADIRKLDVSRFKGVDLITAGLPCPPFSVAGKQLGADDDRNLFPAALRIIGQLRPKAVMIENVAGLLGKKFDGFRRDFTRDLGKLGYDVGFYPVNAADFGVPQNRQRVVIVALRRDLARRFKPPVPTHDAAPTVGETLIDLMRADGWRDAARWAHRADAIAPTIVGDSKKHGGADLGPSGARKAWAALGVDGRSLADTPPGEGFVGMPRLTLPMVQRLQGFPDTWVIEGRKTERYRQIGNAFPPAVAQAFAAQIKRAIKRPKLRDAGQPRAMMAAEA
ncbi:MAG: DNA cytosine methyltransferase [Burkholderiaceae bacterium]